MLNFFNKLEYDLNILGINFDKNLKVESSESDKLSIGIGFSIEDTNINQDESRFLIKYDINGVEEGKRKIDIFTGQLKFLITLKKNMINKEIDNLEKKEVFKYLWFIIYPTANDIINSNLTRLGIGNITVPYKIIEKINPDEVK